MHTLPWPSMYPIPDVFVVTLPHRNAQRLWPMILPRAYRNALLCKPAATILKLDALGTLAGEHTFLKGIVLAAVKKN